MKDAVHEKNLVDKARKLGHDYLYIYEHCAARAHNADTQEQSDRENRLTEEGTNLPHVLKYLIKSYLK